MVRGAKGLAKQQEDQDALSDKPKKFFMRKRRLRAANLDGDKKVPNGPKDINEVTAEDFRRTAKGRQMIRDVFSQLLTIDSCSNPRNPLFDSEGMCRMKYEPARCTKQKDILEWVPQCVELLPLDHAEDAVHSLSFCAFCITFCHFVVKDIA